MWPVYEGIREQQFAPTLRDPRALRTLLEQLAPA
jgi:hypothetical protein